MKLHQSSCSVLSLDIGHRRIGLAGCDPLGITITQLPALHRHQFNVDFEILNKICSYRKVQGLVVGLPLDLNGYQTSQGIHCKRYGLRLAKKLKLPIAWVNEHTSTRAAEELYDLRGDRSGSLDSAAAALILEQWLREGPQLKPVKALVNAASVELGDGGS